MCENCQRETIRSIRESTNWGNDDLRGSNENLRPGKEREACRDGPGNPQEWLYPGTRTQAYRQCVAIGTQRITL